MHYHFLYLQRRKQRQQDEESGDEKVTYTLFHMKSVDK